MSQGFSPPVDPVHEINGTALAGAQALPRAKKSSQRPSLSCSSCAKRKTKCDKTVPCQPCIKRGKSHLCMVEPSGGPKDQLLSGDSSSASSAALADPDSARHAAFQELEKFRTTVDLLRSRISGLEGILATAFTPSAQPTPSAYPRHYPPGPCFDPRSDIPVQHHPQASTSYVPYPADSREASVPQSADGGSSQHEKTATAEELRGEEVEASVALEFMALGRHRAFGASNINGPQMCEADAGLPPHALHAAPFLPSPSALYPSPAALAAAAPPRPQADALIAHSLEWMGWHHAAVHTPSFMREVAEFWGWGERRMEVCSPAWLALWFSLLVVGVGNLAEGQAAALGISEDERSYLARTWFDCAMAALHAANFLQNHSMFAVQAITVLVVTGQDASTSNLIPTLLSTGISIAQDMGLHRMCSDHEWETSMRGAPQDVRAQSLILRSIRQRAFWALPYRRTYVVQPTQVTTPLPSNAHDEDLLTGQLVNRPPSEFTVVSKVLLWIQIARCLQEIFEHMDRNAAPSYRLLLDVDERLSSIISNCPEWLHDDGPTVGMPPCVDWVRNTFRISSNHKVLTLHRPFLHRAFRDPRFESSRIRAITASRAILREAARCSDSRLWTIPYHISAAACVALLDIFQRNGIPAQAASLAELRGEVMGALHALEHMQETSQIARRGVALISNLVAEEARVSDERARAPHAASKRSSKKRLAEEANGDGSEFSKVAKKMSLAEISPPTSGSPSSESTLPSPYLAGANDPALVDFSVPHEFLSVFLGQEFDPLDGAITDPSLDALVGTGFGFGGSAPGAWTI